MPGLSALWDSLVDCICRPPRDEYIYPDELVGGSRRLFRVGRYPGIREDLTLTNKRGLLLQCSHYLPKHVRGKDGRLPCVIYCHCNSGSRRDAEEAICVLIPCGVSVFTLDFAGSGLSEGQWVTLGAEEVDDVATAVEHLRGAGRVSTLGLWGRSMGAVTALLYSHRDPSIAGMVLDSPFARLTDLMLEIVQEQRLPIPRALAKLALAAMKRSVLKRAGFDITKVTPVDVVPQSHIPALFGHATGDTFIRISHAEALHAAYAGEKELIRFEGDHNSRRPEFFYHSVSNFWHRALLLEHLLEPADLTLSTSASTSTSISSPAAATLGSGGSRGSSSRGGAGRPLRPPPMRLRQPEANPALTTAAATAPGSAPSGGGGSGSGSAAATTTAAAAALPLPLPPLPEDAAGPCGGGAVEDGGCGEEADVVVDEEGVDVTGVSSRSAPWEPRLWELDPDKAARERQRFRRMAGGLPSPSRGPAGAANAADNPLAGAASGGLRSSAELAKLFATTSDDESLAARLLGEDPQWSEVLVSEAAAKGGASMAAGPPLPNGIMASSIMAMARLLPTREEEEEEQLRAALELSLLEAGGVPPPPMTSLASVSAAAASSSSSTKWQNGTGPAEAAGTQQQKELQAGVLQPSSIGNGGTGPRPGPSTALGSGPGSLGRGGALGRAGAADSGAGGRVAAAAAAAMSSLVCPDALLAGAPSTSPALAPPPLLVESAAAMQPAMAAATESTTASAGPAAAEDVLPGRSKSHEAPRAQQPLLELMPSTALSGPPHPGQQPEGGPADLLAAAPASEKDRDLPQPGPVAGFSGPTTSGALSALGAVVLRRQGDEQDAADAATAVAATAFPAAPGVNIYDLYTEDELVALAVQLSLQESKAVEAAMAGPGGTAGAATGLPSLL